MNLHAVPAPRHATFTDGKLTLVARAMLAAASIITIITLHEVVHLVVGRLAGIPAGFTGLTSAGLPQGVNPLQYAPLRLALMNGIAPLLTVLCGFAVYYLLARKSAALGHLRYFFTWWAIFGIPYLGIQMMLTAVHVDYSGNGADSAAMAGYFNLPVLVRASICLAGFLYYTVSAIWVLGAIRAADREVLPGEPGLVPPLWPVLSGLCLIALAVAGAAAIAVQAFNGTWPGLLFVCWFGFWAGGTALLTPWKSSRVRVLCKHWLLPGIIGMLILIPVGYLGKGNDYASIWLLILPSLFGATLFAARDITALRHITRLLRPRK